MTVLTTGTTPAPAARALREARCVDDAVVEGPRVLRRLPEGAEERPYTAFEVRPLGRVIGAEIHGVDLREPISEELRAEIHRALLEFKVVFFRDQPITARRQQEIARMWGELETNPFIDQGEDAHIARFAKGDMPPSYENVWHTDVTWREAPAMGAILRLVEVPPQGGDTMWADMGAAYDNLPDEVKERIDGAVAEHDVIPGFARFLGREKLLEWQDRFPPVHHPVVRTHPETGRKTLFVNVSFTTRILGMAPEESDRLLRFLFQQAHVPEYQVRFQWRKDSIAFWDNRATQHYAVNDYHPHRRVAERVAIVGDRPF
ncbi:TauD/TfdA dioxygenase family protein [Streptomonospora nanhaiensis]|uniref:TauD/TfdA dioxygenase family protein n=1 Tax=Streptomonospora nanhaiensis TaxID=1323731 RepID=UPI001C9939B5|nr:TauD/TfdA family dioxygenase [Streptomonospora nanhaiensis]MBX9389934.1 TauD/TfdA family dioxygenase [Streptomonospora nanhaiensis]